MKIVIYSTNTNFYDEKNFSIKQLPKCINNITNCIKNYTSSEVILVYFLPGMFFFDSDIENSELPKEEKISYYPLKEKTAEKIAGEIFNLHPDIAVQASFWTEPFDWIPIQDSLIGEILKSKGIKTVNHPSKTALICFNKKRTRDFLMQNGFNAAKSVYVHHELFRTERAHKEILNNPYQEFILEEIKKLDYPVIIKDSFGLSSYGMDVVKTFPMSKNILFSKKNSGDRLVEEFISGLQFGTEIHGTPGNYTIFPPFLFSTNQYGITSPKQSVKVGPVLNNDFHLEELYKTLELLAEKLELCGIAQVDLVFSNEKWFVIEINPRLSGLSETIACSTEKTLAEMLLDVAFCKNQRNTRLKYVCSIKFPVVTEEMQEKLFNFESVLYVRQMQNKNARQHREEGFCEVIFGAKNSAQELKNDLENLKSSFPEIMEEEFYRKAKELMKFL